MRPTRMGARIALPALIVALGACSGKTGDAPAVEGTTAPPGGEVATPAVRPAEDPGEPAGEPARTAAPEPAENAGAAEAGAAVPDADPAAVVHPSEVAETTTLQRRPMGDRSDDAIFADYYEQHPDLKPDDPEADSVARGRRLVGPIDEELELSFDTPEQLAAAYLDAIVLESPDLFDEIRVSEKEHAAIFWPEFPESRPITNVGAGDAWFFHQGHCREGVMESLAAWGGRRLWLLGVRFDGGIARYRNFNLYHDVVIEAQSPDGSVVELPWAVTFAERNGRWKVYIYHG